MHIHHLHNFGNALAIHHCVSELLQPTCHSAVHDEIPDGVLISCPPLTIASFTPQFLVRPSPVVLLPPYPIPTGNILFLPVTATSEACCDSFLYSSHAQRPAPFSACEFFQLLPPQPATPQDVDEQSFFGSDGMMMMTFCPPPCIQSINIIFQLLSIHSTE